MAEVLTVSGTWGETRGLDWHEWGSPWWLEAEKHGARRVQALDPFQWGGAIDGIVGQNNEWEGAAQRLRAYIAANVDNPKELVIVAWSHGGQVAARAIAGHQNADGSFTRGLYIKRLITIGTPVRREMESYYGRVPCHLTHGWVHVYGTCDIWQWLGSLFDMKISLRRKMPWAWANIREKRGAHARSDWFRNGLLDPDLWTRRGWWAYV